MSVVGIDFGNQNTVVAVARNRGIDVITNDTSNRATPSLVTFGDKQRYLGEAAKTQEISNFKSTVSTLKRVVGRPFSDPDIMKIEKPYINCALEEGPDGLVNAKVFYQNEQQSFSYTQIVAMFLNKVKEFTSSEIKIPVTDCVISCPGWFTDRQRRAILDAASISNLNCLRVMNDLTAAALGYGITKLDLPDLSVTPTLKPKLVCFVDIGHSSMQVSIVSFVKGKLVVKGTAYDRNLGGRDFDSVIAENYVTEFNAKYKLDINSSAKAKFRLLSACEKVKKVLSANANTVLNIECLLDDKDVHAKVSRADFEEWVAPIIARLTAPLERALKNAKCTPADIDAVELIGGSTRIPLIKDHLAKFFGGSLDGENILSTTLNQDEAVSRGCALQCAILSPVFKVRDFSVVDWNAFPVQMCWDNIQPVDGKDKTEMDVFPVDNVIPSSKNMTLYRHVPEEGKKSSFKIKANYTQQAFENGAPIGCGTDIGTWTIDGIARIKAGADESLVENVAANGEVKTSVKVKAKLDGNGVVCIDSAHQIEEFMVSVPPPVEEAKPVEETKDKEGLKKDDSTESMDIDSATKESTPAPEKTKKVTRKYELLISSVTASLSTAKLQEFKAQELEMESSDKLVIDTAEKRNELEEYVYETRSKLEMAWSEYITDTDREIFMKALSDMESWLYTEEGDEATKSIYGEKLNSLKKIGSPVYFRAREAENRSTSEKAAKDYINSILLSLGDEKYEHIEKDELEKVRNECQNKLIWLNDMLGKQNDRCKSDDPIITVDQINKVRDALMHFARPILSKPKPKPVKVEEPTEDTKENADEKAVPEAGKKGESKFDEKVDMEMD